MEMLALPWKSASSMELQDVTCVSRRRCTVAECRDEMQPPDDKFRPWILLSDGQSMLDNYVGYHIGLGIGVSKYPGSNK